MNLSKIGHIFDEDKKSITIIDRFVDDNLHFLEQWQFGVTYNKISNKYVIFKKGHGLTITTYNDEEAYLTLLFIF